MRIVVAMSGGVDSSVAALELVEAGHEVVGATLRLRECLGDEEGTSCCGGDAIGTARHAADALGIPHYVIHSVATFDQVVLAPAWDAYERGLTPSPCLVCNERLKFGSLLDWAASRGADAVATGHYARLVSGPGGLPQLLRGLDGQKDQSYFLAGLTTAQLRKVVFPLGALDKPAVRQRARDAGLMTAETHESQDACLQEPGVTFSELLRRRFDGEARPGTIVDEAGNVLGTHRGIHLFTIGQRRGLGIWSPHPWWVKEIRAEDGTVVVTDHRAGASSTVFGVTAINWLDGELPSSTIRVAVQVRYRHAPVDATLAPTGDGRAVVTLASAVHAVTPGQAAVFYDGARVLGRGWIDTIHPT